MKKKNYLIRGLLLLLIAIPFAACDPVTEDGSFVEPITLYEKIGGTWTLGDMVMIDENADNGWLTNLDGSPTQSKEAASKPEMSINGALGYDQFVMKLNVDGSNQPTTYSVETTAKVSYIPHEGYWELSDTFTNPTGSSPVVYIYSDAAKTNQVASFTVTSVPGASTTMELKFVRNIAGKPHTSYVYKLSKTTEP